MFEYRRNRSTRIHPDNRQDVELIRQRSENHGDSRNTSSRTHDDPCPICLNDSTVLTVQTNCGLKPIVDINFVVIVLFPIGNFKRIG